MAANSKTQLIKLGIGTLSVVAIVGFTGMIGEQARDKDAGPATLAQAEPANPPGISWWLDDHDEEHDDDYDDHDDDDDDDDDDHGVRFARPSTAGGITGQTRTRRS